MMSWFLMTPMLWFPCLVSSPHYHPSQACRWGPEEEQSLIITLFLFYWGGFGILPEYAGRGEKKTTMYTVSKACEEQPKTKPFSFARCRLLSFYFFCWHNKVYRGKSEASLPQKTSQMQRFIQIYYCPKPLRCRSSLNHSWSKTHGFLKCQKHISHTFLEGNPQLHHTAGKLVTRTSFLITLASGSIPDLILLYF